MRKLTGFRQNRSELLRRTSLRSKIVKFRCVWIHTILCMARADYFCFLRYTYPEQDSQDCAFCHEIRVAETRDPKEIRIPEHRRRMRTGPHAKLAKAAK